MSKDDILQYIRDTNNDIREAWPEGTTTRINSLKAELAGTKAQLEAALEARTLISAERDSDSQLIKELFAEIAKLKYGDEMAAEAAAKAKECTPDESKPRFSGRGDHAQMKPPEWLIEGLIPENSDVAIYAPFGALKTFVALDMALSVAVGCKALGQFAVHEAGPVYFFAGEGYHSMVTKRATAWEIEHGMEPFTAPGIRFADGVPITTDDTLVEADIAAIEQELGENGRAKLVVIDTMNRALNGQDEDKSHVAARYLQTLKKMRDRIGGTTITVAHMGKDPDRGERGSSGFPAGFDTILWIEKCTKDQETGVHTVQLLVRKQKDSEDGQRYWLQSKKVATSDGDSLVLIPVDEETGRAGITQPKAHAAISEEDIIAALRNLVPHGGTTSRQELMQQLEKLTRKSQKTISNRLSEHGKEGGAFYRFTRPGGRWGLPLKDHAPISLRDSLRDDDEAEPSPEPNTVGNSIFH